MSVLIDAPFLTLFGIIAVGTLLGTLRVGGVSLGAAGVFFAALVAGHFLAPYGWSLPHELTDLGLVLFVYAVGLSAGPRFFSSLRRSGIQYLTVGLGATLAGALLAGVLARWLGMSADLAAGLYCGATTCTPALAATVDAIRRVADADPGGSLGTSTAMVAYGATYPFSVAAVVLCVQALPRMLRTTPAAAAERFRRDVAATTPPIEVCTLRVSNPNCAGRTIEELQALKVASAVISRVKHAGAVHPARPEAVLHLGDVVMAVGTPTELAKLEALLGEVVVEEMQDPTGRLASDQLLVSRRDVFGKTIRELAIWERFGVVVTRIRRDGMQLMAGGDFRLEPGDLLHVVGPREQLGALADAVGREERRLNETSMIPFAAGIAAGAALGLIPIALPGGLEMRLGLGGGAFVVALLQGHLGTIGPVRLYVPNAAKHFARELGLVIFLAGAGAAAGQRFVPIIMQAGWSLVLAGAAVTLTTVVAALLLIFLLQRWNMLFGAGALSAVMTNPPGLAAASGLADPDAAQSGFASVYPIALISKIVWAPLAFLVLRMLAS